MDKVEFFRDLSTGFSRNLAVFQHTAVLLRQLIASNPLNWLDSDARKFCVPCGKSVTTLRTCRRHAEVVACQNSGVSASQASCQDA